MGATKDPIFTIDFTNNKITDAGVCRPMRAKERNLLDYFVTNSGRLLSLDQIADAVWGEEGCSDANIQDTVSKMRSRFPSVKSCIETIKGIGYRFQLPPDCVIIPSGADAPPADGALAHLMTKTAAALETRKSVIHREADIRALEQLLAEGETALVLSGPGGVGKSSLARVLFAMLSPRYDSVGWVPYYRNLRDSLLAALDLYDDIDDTAARWKCIAKRLRGDRSSKLLVIDNVDFNRFQEQDPLADTLLQEITGWPGMTVVLTSRMAELPGYYAVPIHYLGDEAHPAPCMDLFYHYYARSELERPADRRYQADAVFRLIQYAGYHTYAIELLARSAKYEDSLNDFADQIELLGFRFPEQKFFTSNRQAVDTAAGQLRLLFDRQERSAAEQQILWDFSLLPESTTLSAKEVRQLLNYSPNDLEPLCRDGWLLFERGQGFHIHPLVKEVIHFDLRDGRSPRGTGAHLISLIRSQTLIAPDETQAAVQKKLLIAENAAKYVSLPDPGAYGALYYHLGLLQFHFARKRLTAIRWLQKSLDAYRALPSNDAAALTDQLAEATYQLGYLKSTTHEYRPDAQHDLRAALELWSALGGHERELAMAHDHLGYVLSDDEASFPEAHDHLLQAMTIRKKFMDQSPSEKDLRDWATTCDNLGCLYARWDEKRSFAEPLLMQAWTIRDRIYQTTGKHLTDAAWTAYNLGLLFGGQPDRFADAELYLQKTLDMRRRQEADRPGMYTTNVVSALVALAKLLLADPQRFAQLCALTDEAVRLHETIDPEHTSFSSRQLRVDLDLLRAHIRARTTP